MSGSFSFLVTLGGALGLLATFAWTGCLRGEVQELLLLFLVQCSCLRGLVRGLLLSFLVQSSCLRGGGGVRVPFLSFLVQSSCLRGGYGSYSFHSWYSPAASEGGTGASPFVPGTVQLPPRGVLGLLLSFLVQSSCLRGGYGGFSFCSWYSPAASEGGTGEELEKEKFFFPLELAVNKSPAVYLLSRALDGL